MHLNSSNPLTLKELKFDHIMTFTSYPFHTAKAAVTRQLCLDSAYPICFAFTLRFPHYDRCGVKRGVRKGVQSIALLHTLFGLPFHIDNLTVAKCGFLLECPSKTPFEVVADPHSEYGFPTSESNAILEQV